MAFRISSVDLEKTVEVDPDIDVTPFIRRANLLTNKVSSADSNSELTDADLKEIECCLAAHFYGRRDQFLTSKSHGGASGSFMGSADMFLSSSQYGQDAMTLDVTGYLSKLNQQLKSGQKQKATVTWLGSEYKDDRSKDNIENWLE